ncbi:WXG100 family type VII secretion target [Actinokineospora soli]|uniref:WXG100 family type VII secretion target n=1 Tax=Actinokineospora soli TaxID=1048753 RepID=A0ABW2TJU3_9PSEU
MGAGSADRYVVGGVNWESYTLEALIAMVADNASPAQLVQLADDWRQAGSEVSDSAAVLETALAQLMEFWSGTAAEQAREDVAANAQWLADLGDTAHQIGDPIQEAAGALKAAQDAMPALPPPLRSTRPAPWTAPTWPWTPAAPSLPPSPARPPAPRAPSPPNRNKPA